MKRDIELGQTSRQQLEMKIVLFTTSGKYRVEIVKLYGKGR